MRGFIVLAFLVAAANAVNLGYNYGPGLSGTKILTNSQLIGTPGIGVGNIISGGSLGGGTRIVSSGGNLIGGGISGISGISGIGGIGGGGGTVIGGGIGGGLVSGGIGGGLIGGGSIGGQGGTTVIGIDAVDSIPQTVEYNKQVFYFSAPEEEQNEGVITQQLSNVLKKNLQVVFIKAPENSAATNAALQLAKQAIEQRTAIYLLSKENDASQVVGQLQQIQENVPTVPEVRIIKYRTQEDLINAQATIQAQYDNIGGPSPLINGGVVPVLNYASGGGSLSGGVNIIGGGLGGGIGGISTIGGGLGGGYGGISLGGGSYGTGVTKIIGGSPVIGGVTKVIGGGGQLVGGVTKIIGGGISSSGGYLPPHLKK